MDWGRNQGNVNPFQGILDLQTGVSLQSVNYFCKNIFGEYLYNKNLIIVCPGILEISSKNTFTKLVIEL